MDDRLYCIWLSLAVTPGKDTFKKLIEKFNTAKEIFEAEADDIAVCVGSLIPFAIKR